ncbi:hypothetical protein Q4488_06745 [Amphritea sp. 1_MG-2023]|uniref:pilus assembly PilX family protein n=1 Tax=Amphritea sp. 1_MG-2023 TaxID=3062670 RepID=UPI0026E1FC38|nr:hypothetical protein [Amphritea sp. 1_MG-2023]MDO6563082.1 hypothetical protein [Amphritea sp. 1_MG-2023]
MKQNIKQPRQNKPVSLVTGAAQAQRGFTTLAIGLIILFAASLATFAVVKTSRVEQRMNVNELRAKEVRHAADAALDFGIAWYAENSPAWTTSGSIQTASPSTVMPTITSANTDSYSATISYQRTLANPNYILVTALVAATSEANITATAQRYIYTNSLLTTPGTTGPPMIIDGCLDNVTGNPDIYPSGYDSGSGAGPYGDAIVTSESATEADGSSCIELGHLDIHGGSIATNSYSGDPWDELFTVSRTAMQAIADQEVADGVADSDRTVVWVTSTSNYHDSWGSATSPVIVVFDAVADCPKINGNPTFYGVVFIDSACDSSNGWGGTTVYGSVGINGDVSKMTANSEIYDWSEVSGGDTSNLAAETVPQFPGTWKDF